ncbi:MAG: hypothetical protein KBT10_03955 [Bacteroidales bacterium]|nr:hypothetical protein [Candidatus Sodaliphilus aphodohippi]
MRNIFVNISNAIKSQDRKAQLRLLLWGSIVVFLVLLALGRFHVSHVDIDTDTYITAGKNYFAGIMDRERTPVYPVIYHMACLFGNTVGEYIIVLLQELVFLCSVVFLYRAVRMVFPERNITTFIVVALYAWNPAIVQYQLLIMTESLALSASALLLYLMCKGILQQFTLRNAVALAVLYLFMLFLRPFFICFAPLLVLFYLFARKHMALPATGVFWAGIAITFVAYLGYCGMFQRQYGVFTTSSVADINLNAQLYESGITPDAIWKADTFDLKQEHDHNRRLLMGHKGIWFKHMVSETFLSGRQLYPSINLQYGGKVSQMFSWQVPLAGLYIATLLFVLIAIYRWRKGHDMRLELMVAMIILTTAFTAVWGAFSSYSRLVLPCYPCACLMVGYYASLLRITTRRQ